MGEISFSHSFIFFTYLGVLLGSILLFGLLGKGLLLLFRLRYHSRGSFFNNLFFDLFTGIMFFSVSVSVIYTSFRTVQLGFVVLFLVGLGFVKRKKPAIVKHPLKEELPAASGLTMKVVFVVLPLIVYYLLQYYLTVAAFNYPYYQPSADFSFYSTVSEYLLNAGIENTNHVFNLLDDSFQNLVPYHYFELWLNGGMSRLFGLNTYLSLYLVVSSLFFLTIFYGLLAIFEALQVKSSWILLVCLFFPLMDRLQFDFFDKIPLISNADPFNSLLVSLSNNNVSKIGPYYLFLIPALLFAIKKNYYAAVLFLLGLSVATITTAPAIFAGLFMVVAVAALVKKIAVREAVTYLVYILVAGTFIALFYYFNQSSSPAGKVGNDESLIEVLSNTGKLKTKFNLFVGNWLILLFIYLPFILLLVYKRSVITYWLKNVGLVSLFIITIIFAGLFTWAVLSHLPNASQLGARVASSFINLFLFVGIVLLFVETEKSAGQFNKWALGIFLIFLFYNAGLFFRDFMAQPKVTASYATGIMASMQTKIKNMVGACIIAPEDFPKSSVTKNSNYYVLGLYLPLINNGYRVVSLSDFSIPAEDTTDLIKLSTYAKDGVFYDYVEELKNKKAFTSLAQSQLSFIKENNIHYLILSKSANLPDQLKPLVASQWQDSISKERFIVLNNTIGL
jgi:hypothetical protein